MSWLDVARASRGQQFLVSEDPASSGLSFIMQEVGLHAIEIRVHHVSSLVQHSKFMCSSNICGRCLTRKVINSIYILYNRIIYDTCKLWCF